MKCTHVTGAPQPTLQPSSCWLLRLTVGITWDTRVKSPWYRWAADSDGVLVYSFLKHQNLLRLGLWSSRLEWARGNAQREHHSRHDQVKVANFHQHGWVSLLIAILEPLFI